MRGPPELLLLPGMDGTGDLFSAFTECCGSATVVRYPTDEPLGYDDLLTRIHLPTGPFVLVGESFSGPLAVRIAAAAPPGLVALVLVGSFVSPPAPAALRLFAGRWAFWYPPPSWAIRAALAGPDAPADLVRHTRRAIASVEPEVLARRLREILDVDVTAALAVVRAPILTLAGTRDRLVRRPIPLDGAPRAAATRAVALDAPHLILQRRPAQALAAIQAFLEAG